MKNVDCVLPDHLDDLWQQVVPARGRHLVVRSGVRVVGNKRGGGALNGVDSTATLAKQPNLLQHSQAFRKSRLLSHPKDARERHGHVLTQEYSYFDLCFEVYQRRLDRREP